MKTVKFWFVTSMALLACLTFSVWQCGRVIQERDGYTGKFKEIENENSFLKGRNDYLTKEFDKKIKEERGYIREIEGLEEKKEEQSGIISRIRNELSKLSQPPQDAPKTLFEANAAIEQWKERNALQKALIASIENKMSTLQTKFDKMKKSYNLCVDSREILKEKISNKDTIIKNKDTIIGALKKSNLWKDVKKFSVGLGLGALVVLLLGGGK